MSMSIEPITEEFIGRNLEIAFFSQWLKDIEAPSIIYVHDELEELDKKGGIGKSWLLRKFYDLVKERYTNTIPVMLDFFNVADRDGVVVAERIVEALQQRYPQWEPEYFQRMLDEYHEVARGRIAETANIRERMGEALVDDLRLLQLQMREDNTYVLLFFDTFELIERNPVTAVLRPVHLFPDMYQSNRIRIVMAGRNVPDWSHPNWTGREREVVVRPLPPFSREEALQYLDVHSYVHDIKNLPAQTLQGLYERTEGRPILVGLVTDVLNKRIQTPDTLTTISKQEFEASLVEEINEFDDPSRWAIFSMAHIYHRFNADLLNLLMNRPGLKGLVPEIQYQELLTVLPMLSFVRRSMVVDNFVLHDEMRRLVNKYCWEKQDPDKRIRRELSELAIEYYSQLIMQEQQEEMRHSYTAETLFHQLFINVDNGFRYFHQHFNRAVASSLWPFARALFQELQQFEQEVSHEQHQNMRLSEARLLLGEIDPQAALRICLDLEQDREWVDLHRSDLLYNRSQCYLQMNQFSEAESCIQACLEIESTNKDKTRYAQLFTALGYIYRRRGQYNEALYFYERSLRIQRNLDDELTYADLLNNMGNVLRYLNKLEEALRYCKLALRIRRDLYMQGKASELFVGLSLSTLGHIYHALDEVIEEESAYWNAFNIYNRIGDKRAVAGTYNCLGRVRVRKGELESALEDFRQAYRIAIGGINREAEIESLNQQGRVFVAQRMWQESIDYFEQVVKLARQVSQSFRLAENLLYLAASLEHLGQPSSELIKEAKRISRKHGYNGLLGKAGEIQGDMYYSKQEYQRAFKFYRIACRYIALRGSPEFERFLRKLYDVLLEIPTSFLPGAVDSLLEYWFDLGMDKEYPQLLNICREVSEHMVL